VEDIAMAKVWLITGSGNGLGRDIAEAALAAGDSVVAGARRREELAPLVAQRLFARVGGMPFALLAVSSVNQE
jgi:NAD(P)-dependent dehydrogenase (short-subunit alcohol dehydrogenase family)